jgi:hypothetical protein
MTSLSRFGKSWWYYLKEGLQLLLLVLLAGGIARLFAETLFTAGSWALAYLPLLDDPWLKGIGLFLTSALAIPLFGFLFLRFNSRLRAKE